MKTEFDEYTRIGKGFLGMSSLWMGNDHLLYIKGSGFFLPFREEYRRFRYQDIQAVSTVRTGGMWGYGVLLLLGLALFSLITYAILIERDPDSNLGLAWMLAVPLPLALLCFIFLVRNFVLGPRCICELQTALKRERIGPLSRSINARHVISVLDERIQEHQKAARAEIPGNSAATLPDSTPQPQVVPRLATLSLIVSTITGLALVAGLHFENVPLVIATFVGLLASIVLTLSNLIISVRNPCPDSFRAFLWILFGALFSISGTSLVHFAVIAFDNPEFTVGASGPFEAFASISPQGSLIFYLIFLILGIVMTISSLLALMISSRTKKKSV